jgi:hypothetical protein
MAPSANYIEEETLASLVALPVASFEKEQLKLQVEFTASELSSPELSASELASPEPLSTVAFGGDDGWHYIPETKRFDLSRNSRTKLVIDADDGIRNHRGCLIVRSPHTSSCTYTHRNSL